MRLVGESLTVEVFLVMHKMLALKVGTVVFTMLNLALCATAATAPALSQVLPQSTAIPVRFVHSVDAKTAKVGDAVTAKTIQIVTLPGGMTITKGSTLVGHVVDIQAFHFDPSPYAHQKPSLISIHFDKLQTRNAVILVNLSVRAVANTIESQEAAYPHSTDDTDHVGMMTLIGGTEFSPLDKTIQSEGGDVIGYNRRSGVFARLIPSDYSAAGSTLHCGGTSTEQSLAIFSPSACGVYGFGGVYMPNAGRDGSGTFTLATQRHSMKLYAGSTALLQVNESK
jgi:hypothetical protein